MFQHTRDLTVAAQLFSRGQLANSLNIYHHIQKQLKQQKYGNNNNNEYFLSSIQSTIGVIQTALGNYQIAQQYFELILDSVRTKQLDTILVLRTILNLMFIDLMKQRYEDSIEKFNVVMQIVIKSQNKIKLIKFVNRLLFRVEKLQQLELQINIPSDKIVSLMEAVMLSSLTRIKHLTCKQKQLVDDIIQVQKYCYSVFIHYKRFDYSLAVLRHLLQLNLSSQQIQFYKKQLGKIMSMGIIQSIQLDNDEIIEKIKIIYDTLYEFQNELDINQQKNHKFGTGISKFAITYVFQQMIKKTSNTIEIQTLKQTLNMILNESDKLITTQLKKSMFVQNSIDIFLEKVAINVKKVYTLIQKHQIQQIKQGFALIKQFSILKTSNKSTNFKSPHKSMNKQLKFGKQNYSPSPISNKTKDNLSINSFLAHTPERSIFNQSTIIQKSSTQRKVTKMIRLIQHGMFLNKRNFSSDGGQYKFVKITSSMIKWGKNPQKVNDGQCYPLKDIKGIVYGKFSPTLNKHQNKLLQPYLCFSLILQKRTLDFYCKTYDEVQAWVCGLSVVLKKNGRNINGYTIGKLLWKKMLYVLRWNFVQPLKQHERNTFYLQNAFAVTQFGKNNYKLPNYHP